MQNDLISRSALIEHMCRSCTSKCNLDDECCCSVDAVENAPAVDAVEVVRCKDCKYYRVFKGVGAWCHRRFRSGIEYKVKPHDFCSYGERRADNGE